MRPPFFPSVHAEPLSDNILLSEREKIPTTPPEDRQHFVVEIFEEDHMGGQVVPFPSPSPMCSDRDMDAISALWMGRLTREEKLAVFAVLTQAGFDTPRF